ncbi:MAG: pyrroloquinoline quinone biosynthesis protein PqqE, partial [Acetobacteraceae bacterium]
MTVPPPLGLLAELTHRCPLRCPYCSNPTALTRRSDELDSNDWARVFQEAAGLGVLHLHLSGGEPAARADLPALVAAAARAGLYTNLITSGLGLDGPRLAALADAGLDHVQLSLQDSEPGPADDIAGLAGAHARKLDLASRIHAAGLPLTVNAVVHRRNLDRLDGLIDLALALGAGRMEVAHAQYYGWALRNRAALQPTRAQVDAAAETVARRTQALFGAMRIDYVPPDYHATRPKPCMGGWGQRVMVITPTGKALPCHAAETLPGLAFESVRDRDLRWIWEQSAAFNRFRGSAWMRAPCATCAFREADWGGCRCQAFALTADATATDPVCRLSPH